MTTPTLIPLIELIPPGHTDAQCRALLRSSRRFKPLNGRWVFTKRDARIVQRYLESH